MIGIHYKNLTISIKISKEISDMKTHRIIQIISFFLYKMRPKFHSKQQNIKDSSGINRQISKPVEKKMPELGNINSPYISKSPIKNQIYIKMFLLILRTYFSVIMLTLLTSITSFRNLLWAMRKFKFPVILTTLSQITSTDYI